MRNTYHMTIDLDLKCEFGGSYSLKGDSQLLDDT